MKDEYQYELNQLSALIEGESDEVSVLANVAAALHHSSSRFFWTGFYLLKNDNQLHLGPFQGPIACYRIPIGKGVCGTAFAEKRTYIVPDVEAFPGHIACSSLSRSEIVVPIFNKTGQPVGVIDIDSKTPNAFNETDAAYLEQVAHLLSRHLY